LPSPQTHEAYEALLGPTGEAEPPAHLGGRAGDPPFIGRAAEKQRLAGLWRSAEQGSAHFVLVTGEPGIGKTRLVEEFRAWCLHRGALSIEARAYPAEGMLAYGPIVAWLRGEPVQARLQRLGAVHLTELVRLLPELQADGVVPPVPESR